MLSLMFLCSHSCHHGAGLCAQWHPSLPANNDKMALLSSPVSHLLQYLLSCGQEGKEVGILQACNLTEHRIFVFWDLNTCGLESQFFDWFWGIITLVKEDFVNRFLWAHYGESKMARVNRADEEMRDRVGQSDARPSLPSCSEEATVTWTHLTSAFQVPPHTLGAIKWSAVTHVSDLGLGLLGDEN